MLTSTYECRQVGTLEWERSIKNSSQNLIARKANNCSVTKEIAQYLPFSIQSTIRISVIYLTHKAETAETFRFI